MPDSLRLALGTLTAIRVPAPRTVDRQVARAALLLAPAVGLLLGVLAAALVYCVRVAASPTTSMVALLASVLAIGALAGLTRGLHLDGLADTVDGLGVKGAGDTVVTERLAAMRSPEVGAFGVVALVLTLLLQAVALATCVAGGFGTAALVVGVTTSRLAATWAASAGLPAARPDGLGAAVAGSVPRRAALAVTMLVLVGAVVVGLLDDDGGVRVALTLVSAAVAGLGAGVLLVRRCVRRLGGVTGDVIGAAVETTLTVVLVVLAIAL
jgi:adenosylcobinamide-GDP ribazoletransferase